MTIRMASHAIRAGEGDQYIAAGVEAVSRAGLGAGMMEEAKHPKLNGSEGSLYDVYIPMGMTAENVAERCNVSREAQDEWAAISQNRAVDARDSGHFDAEIVPVTVPAHKDTDKEGNEIDVPETVVDKDDGPRPGTTIEVLGEAQAGLPARAGRSPPATRARSTTAPPRCSSCPTRRPQLPGARAEGADHRLDGRGDPA